MKKNLIRNLIGCISLTSALFAFQACYGTPEDFSNDILINGQVRSNATHTPVKGIKVSLSETSQYCFTDADGKFAFYTLPAKQLKVSFEDTDAEQNGLFQSRDTILTSPAATNYLDIKLLPK